MPAKGRRVASRQAQLNRRRRRQARAGTESAVQTADFEENPTSASVAPPRQQASASASESETVSVAQPQVRPEAAREAERGRNPGRSAHPMAYTHLATEFRRITIMAGIVTVVLVTVSFVI